MNHMSEILERAHIQCIREYLLRGAAGTDINPKGSVPSSGVKSISTA